jgi:hypothetical protein
MRPVAEIRADLEHPHVVPLLRTGLGDGPIGRLLRDVEPLLDDGDAERDGAQRECAELWDALDAARMVIDEAQAKIRGRDQAVAREQAAAVVVMASSVRSCDDCKGRTLAEMQARYLEVRQHRLSTAGLANDGLVVDTAGCPITTSELLTATRHEIADVTLAAVTLANLLGVTVEACIAEKTEADRGRG